MNVVLLNDLLVKQERISKLKDYLISNGHVFDELYLEIDEKKYNKSIEEADILIINNKKVSNSFLDKATNLKYIIVAFTGVDHLDLEYCKNRGIIVSNASGYSTEAVAELVVGLIISKIRMIPDLFECTLNGESHDNILIGSELEKKTVGLFGFGKIGRRVAQLLAPFNVKLIAYSHHKINDLPTYVSEVTFDELVKNSDFLSIHTPLNDSTRNTFTLDIFKKMKRSSILINTGRGPIVNFNDLATALEERIIGGALLDVYDKEPPLDNDVTITLKYLNNVIALPHVGYLTKEAMQKRFDIVEQNLISFINDARILNRVV